jgi:hypothetical protein
MIRIFEVLIALLIVFLVAVVVGVLLPSHGHIERTVEVSSPLRQVYDSVNTFRRYPQWSGLRNFDPDVQMTLSGPEAGPGAKVSWTSNALKVGNGSLDIVKSEQDSSVEIGVDNHWKGTNKKYTVNLVPSSSGKTLKINVAYDVDYGWNLLWRYAGLYINGEPAAVIQGSLNNLSAMLAGFPNTDYKDQDISLVEIAAKPLFLVATKAARSLEDVAIATETALTEIDAALTTAGLTKAGPVMTITSNWGDEDYAFSVAVPVNAPTFTVDGQTYTIETPVPPPAATDDQEETGEPVPPSLGEKDDYGMLVVGGNVRAALWYQGRALYTQYTGSPAALPLLRLNQKAYAETHGYRYDEAGLGRFWDEMISPEDVPEGEQTFRVYLPIQQ